MFEICFGFILLCRLKLQLVFGVFCGFQMTLLNILIHFLANSGSLTIAYVWYYYHVILLPFSFVHGLTSFVASFIFGNIRPSDASSHQETRSICVCMLFAFTVFPLVPTAVILTEDSIVLMLILSLLDTAELVEQLTCLIFETMIRYKTDENNFLRPRRSELPSELDLK